MPSLTWLGNVSHGPRATAHAHAPPAGGDRRQSDADAGLGWGESEASRKRSRSFVNSLTQYQTGARRPTGQFDETLQKVEKQELGYKGGDGRASARTRKGGASRKRDSGAPSGTAGDRSARTSRSRSRSSSRRASHASRQSGASGTASASSTSRKHPTAAGGDGGDSGPPSHSRPHPPKRPSSQASSRGRRVFARRRTGSSTGTRRRMSSVDALAMAVGASGLVADDADAEVLGGTPFLTSHADESEGGGDVADGDARPSHGNVAGTGGVSAHPSPRTATATGAGAARGTTTTTTTAAPGDHGGTHRRGSRSPRGASAAALSPSARPTPHSGSARRASIDVNAVGGSGGGRGLSPSDPSYIRQNSANSKLSYGDASASASMVQLSSFSSLPQSAHEGGDEDDGDCAAAADADVCGRASPASTASASPRSSRTRHPHRPGSVKRRAATARRAVQQHAARPTKQQLQQLQQQQQQRPSVASSGMASSAGGSSRREGAAHRGRASTPVPRASSRGGHRGGGVVRPATAMSGSHRDAARRQQQRYIAGGNRGHGHALRHHVHPPSGFDDDAFDDGGGGGACAAYPYPRTPTPIAFRSDPEPPPPPPPPGGGTAAGFPPQPQPQPQPQPYPHPSPPGRVRIPTPEPAGTPRTPREAHGGLAHPAMSPHALPHAAAAAPAAATLDRDKQQPPLHLGQVVRKLRAGVYHDEDAALQDLLLVLHYFPSEIAALPPAVQGELLCVLMSGTQRGLDWSAAVLLLLDRLFVASPSAVRAFRACVQRGSFTLQDLGLVPILRYGAGAESSLRVPLRRLAATLLRERVFTQDVFDAALSDVKATVVSGSVPLYNSNDSVGDDHLERLVAENWVVRDVPTWVASRAAVAHGAVDFSEARSLHSCVHEAPAVYYNYGEYNNFMKTERQRRQAGANVIGEPRVLLKTKAPAGALHGRVVLEIKLLTTELGMQGDAVVDALGADSGAAIRVYLTRPGGRVPHTTLDGVANDVLTILQQEKVPTTAPPEPKFRKHACPTEPGAYLLSRAPPQLWFRFKHQHVVTIPFVASPALPPPVVHVMLSDVQLPMASPENPVCIAVTRMRVTRSEALPFCPPPAEIVPPTPVDADDRFTDEVYPHCRARSRLDRYPLG